MREELKFHRPFRAPLSSEYRSQLVKEVLPDNAWKGEPCFIVGGGPSLRRFDFSRLKGKKTIGINLAFLFFEPSIIFSMDASFFRRVLRGEYDSKYEMDVARWFMKSKALKVCLLTYAAALPSDMLVVPVFFNYKIGLKAFPLSMEQGIGHGNSSGYGALNLAACLGANPIYLLGYDLKIGADGASHFHLGHLKSMAESKLESMRRYFDFAAQALEPSGIRVVNLNPDSALKCFEFMRPEEVLR